MRLLFFLTTGALLAQNLVPAPGPAWQTWSPRPDLRPASENTGGVLRLVSHDFASFGKWLAPRVPIQAGRFYRCEVLYRAEGIPDERANVGIMLSWNSADGPVQRDYVDRIVPTEGGWRRASRVLEAPRNAQNVMLELWLRGAASGSVSFREPSLVEVPRPVNRKVRIVTTKNEAAFGTTVADNLKLMAEVLDQAGREHPDVILLTETLPSRGVPGKAHELAQPIPGAATRLLSEKARQYKSYVIAGLLESEGGRVYNVAVLMDREGRLAGKYRKTHLPLAEVEDGITPGSEYPVYDTDFGRIGILICWDVVFPEPARILRLAGAEMVFLPIAGDPIPGHWDTITRARAMDNGVFLVTSMSQGLGSRIVNPQGEVLAEATQGLATAELDLDRQSRVWWLSVGPAEGEARSLFIQERRPDTYGALAVR